MRFAPQLGERRPGALIRTHLLHIPVGTIIAYLLCAPCNGVCKGNRNATFCPHVGALEAAPTASFEMVRGPLRPDTVTEHCKA